MSKSSKCLAGLLAVLVVITVACGNSDDSSSSTEAAGAPARESSDQVDVLDEVETEEGTPVASGEGTGGGTDLAVLAGRSLIRTGSITVRSEDVPSAVAEAKRAVAASGGFVASERSELAAEFPSAEIVFRVPPGQYDGFSSKLGEVGEVVSQVSNTDDVTDQLVDLDVRIANARASVERIRELFDRAATVTELAQLEAELSSREADLERLLASRSGIDDQVSWSTITLNLFSDPSVQIDDDPPAGFTDGLRTGWDALVGFLNVVAVIFGFVLPWSPLLVAVAAGLWWMRRVLRSRAARRPPKPAPVATGWPQAHWQGPPQGAAQPQPQPQQPMQPVPARPGAAPPPVASAPTEVSPGAATGDGADPQRLA